MEGQLVMEGGGRDSAESVEKGNMLMEGLSESGSEMIAKELLQVIERVESFSNYARTQRKECLNLVRRLKLLAPLFEELRDLHASISREALLCLANLKKSLYYAKNLLKTCNYGSKIYLAFENEAVMSRFQAAYDKLYQALDNFHYEELGISEEVKEQVELMRMQLKRAKSRTDSQDIELAMDMIVMFSKNDDRNADSAILERLAKKLELHTIADLKTETIAVSKFVHDKGIQTADSVQRIVDLLGKFKQIAGLGETTVLDDPMSKRRLEKCRSLMVPHEFLCPVTLEIMTDPVIVASGQTFERVSIQRWLNSNHRTCPKSGQTLSHLSLAPNVALRNLILQWCEKNNFDLPRQDMTNSSNSSSAEIMEEICCLVQNLSSDEVNVQMEAIVKVRMLSKENPENRILIANAGGIPPMIQLLSYPDPKLQEHTVTALLNLSLDDANKRLIAREGAIPAIIEILQNGTDEARENSAAALFSLSLLDENKVMIGCLNGIPPLVDLLRAGTIRGKKDAATALFNLCLNTANKSKAIKAGIIPSLLHLLEDKKLGMIDEALSILLLLASYPGGQNEIGCLEFIETLVGIIRDGTPKNKECATAVLLELSLKNSSVILAALQYGVYDHLAQIARCGTNRAQRKANSLLQHISKCEHIPSPSPKVAK